MLPRRAHELEMKLLPNNECPSSKVLLKNIAHTRRAFLDVYSDSSYVGNSNTACPQCKQRLKHASNGTAANLAKHIRIQHLGASSSSKLSSDAKDKLLKIIGALKQRKSRK